MRLRFAAACVCAVLCTAAGLAHASTTDWLIYLRASDPAGGWRIADSQIYGTRASAQDGLEANDYENKAMSGQQVALGCFFLGPGNVGYGYYRDLRSAHTLQDTWRLNLWLLPECTVTRVMLAGWNPSGTYDLPATQPMQLAVISDPTGTYSPNTVLFTWTGSTNGSSASPEFTVYFDNAQVLKGTPDTNPVLLELRPVPEPSALVVLVCGVGVVGLLRRKH